jgi:hypothetical protein
MRRFDANRSNFYLYLLSRYDPHQQIGLSSLQAPTMSFQHRQPWRLPLLGRQRSRLCLHFRPSVLAAKKPLGPFGSRAQHFCSSSWRDLATATECQKFTQNICLLHLHPASPPSSSIMYVHVPSRCLMPAVRAESALCDNRSPRTEW